MTAPTLAQRFACWPELQSNYERLQQTTLLDLFTTNPQRVNDCKIEAAGLQLDYSKNFIDKKTLSSLLKLAEQAHLPKAIEALLTGAVVNNTEKRPALHTALRSPQPAIEAKTSQWGLAQL